jgi:hypothetical protein
MNLIIRMFLIHTTTRLAGVRRYCHSSTEHDPDYYLSIDATTSSSLFDKPELFLVGNDQLHDNKVSTLNRSTDYSCSPALSFVKTSASMLHPNPYPW